ncbi:MAG: hypothetical protein JWO06_2205, partial [Bacteroidota bacterium]|nr:hypothetical protein [Bacteroidota bacterium]
TIPSSCPAGAECKTIKDFSFNILDSIEAVSAQQWNQRIPETNVLMQHEQLQLIEATQKGKMQFRYVFVKKDEINVGVVYFQLVRFIGADLLNYFPEEPAGAKKYLYRTAKAISEPLVRSVDVKLLVSGNVFMTGENGFYFNQDIDKKTRAVLLRKAIIDVAKTDRQIRAILISDLYEPKSDFDEGFKRCGYSEITVESDMSIHIRPEWKSFDDYLGAFSSKYRVRARKAFSLVKESQVVKKDLNEEEIAQCEDRLFELYEKVIGRAEFKLASLTKDFFRLQKKQMGDKYRVFAYYKGEEMVAFISLFHDGRRMEVHYTGMEQEVCKPIHLYQHMMYDMVEFGINNKFERLHFGRTAPEIKSTIGATPSPMYGYVKHLNPIFNYTMVRTFTARLKPAQYVLRNPFK